MKIRTVKTWRKSGQVKFEKLKQQEDVKSRKQKINSDIKVKAKQKEKVQRKRMRIQMK